MALEPWGQETGGDCCSVRERSGGVGISSAERAGMRTGLLKEARPTLLPGTKMRNEDYLEYFVQEVRRFYPFFPFVGGCAREEFSWRGHCFSKGTWVLLDLYSTNHDPRLWEEPEAFRPERFNSWNGSAYNFIPQGAGDHYHNHRCPGEWITIELIKQAVGLLVKSMHYVVPKQELGISLTRMPALPKSGFIIGQVKQVP